MLVAESTSKDTEGLQNSVTSLEHTVELFLKKNGPTERMTQLALELRLRGHTIEKYWKNKDLGYQVSLNYE